MVSLNVLKQISDYEWEIPQKTRSDMRVPVRLFATRELLEAAFDDKSIEQAINAATLPGLVGNVIVMPDMHQGYGFPIGGVAATRYPDGVISPGAIGYDINCLAGETPILHEHGYTRRLDEIVENRQTESLACFSFARQRADTTQSICWFRQLPRAPVLHVTTETGRDIVATVDHPFWTPDGMIPVGRLRVGDRVAIYPFRGVAYVAPPDAILVSEADFRIFLKQLGKTDQGNAVEQIVNHLRRRGLLPLRHDSVAVPYLCKLLGFVFGDGTVRFASRDGKGVVAFYGQSEDLEDIRQDLLQISFKPSRIWSQARTHRIRTMYGAYEFERTEHWVTVNSTALAALLAYLGAPIGNKAKQDYTLPPWLQVAPLWHKRLFLAAFFGAELSVPGTVSGHGHNCAAPTLSMNKHEGYEASGRRFLRDVAAWLNDFGIATRPIGSRPEQVNADGRRSIRLRLVVQADPENLDRLWSTIGFVYNRKRQAAAAVAVQYLAHKRQWIVARESIAERAVALAESGATTSAIVAQLTGVTANVRFIERSLYGGRRTTPRIGDDFPTLEEFRGEATAGLGDSGMVWDRIVSSVPLRYEGLVYDFTVDHADHNFVARSFVVSNCGVRLLGSAIEYDAVKDQLDELATALNQHCPSGVGSEGAVRLSESELNRVCERGSRWAQQQGYATEQDLRRTEERGCLEGAVATQVSKRAKERGRSQLGTLGAGNHFIEVDVVDRVFAEDAAQVMGLQEGCLVVQIHCGSRGFGHQICTDYVQEFQGAVKRYGISLPDRELVCAPLNSPEGQSYLAAMRCAANFAFANRQILAHAARQAFETVLAGKLKNWHLHQVYDITHNMGKIETHEIDGVPMKVCVHRKGATRAFGPGALELPEEYRAMGQPVLVPGSMGTASWVLAGTEASMQRSFGSSCHGAGRVMSRHQAKREVQGETLRQELEAGGIHVRAGSLPGLAEEAPQAYKDVDAVVETVAGAGIARLVARLKPVAVIKG